MPKFKVTIRQYALEERTFVIEAHNHAAAEAAASAEVFEGDGFEFLSIPDRWIENVEEMETEDEKA